MIRTQSMIKKEKLMMKFFLDGVLAEIKRAISIHPPINSAHEGYGVIKEEFDEFWDEVKKKSEFRNKPNMCEELIQMAAMCVRTAVDIGLCSEKIDEDRRREINAHLKRQMLLLQKGEG